MLSIDNLNVWLPDPYRADSENNEIHLITDLSLQVRRNQTVALVGESGSGKSLTALSILRLLEESSTMRLDGSIRFDGQELLSVPLNTLRQIRGNRIAMIFQEPMTSLNPVFTIGNQLGESLKLHRNLGKEDIRTESIKMLARTGIVNPESRLSAYPHQLSGGQRQRVMIAMALACAPDLLIADEPTTALDVSVQFKILELIDDIKEEYQMSILLISHDLALVRSMADYIYIMKDGKVLEHGETQNIFKNPGHEYTQQLIDAIPQPGSRTNQEKETLIEVKELTCSFNDAFSFKNIFSGKKTENRVVDHISFSIRQGTTCGVIGESGSGKTTLALALLQLIPSSGMISFSKTRLDELSKKQMRAIRNKLQIVFQDPYSSLSPRMTIGEIVQEGLRVHHAALTDGQRREQVLQTLADVGLEKDILGRYPHEFSGGQRQRIAIARAIILRPDLLVLDEPTSALDMTIQAQIIDLLNALQEKYGLTYLFISHDLKVIRAICDDLIVMQGGCIVESGDAETLFNEPQNEYTRHLFSASIYR